MAREKSSAQLHGAAQPRYGAVHIRNRGRLPHWEKEEGLYFITFYLADSLPRTVLTKIAERRDLLSAAKQKNAHLLPEQKTLLAAYSHTRIEEYFDQGAGSCPFLDMRIAGAMAAALPPHSKSISPKSQPYCTTNWKASPSSASCVSSPRSATTLKL